MEYRVLGPLEIAGDDGPIKLGGAKPRALVALLLAARGEMVPIETVADELWATQPPRSATATLHAYVSRLRRVLPDGVLVTERGSYALRPDGAVDRDTFERAVAEARAAHRDRNHRRTSDFLSAGLNMWRGDALPELVDSNRGRAEAARLGELRLGAQEDRFEAELALGAHQELLPELETAVSEEPLRERRWGQLMLALYRAGRQSDALARYQRLRGHLAEELGLDPGPELGRLEQAILIQDPKLDAPGAAARAASPGAARALPAPVTSFVGRVAATAELAAAMRANRLVTVVGPGGVGKTRLAVELARTHREDEPGDVVAFVELAALTDGALVSSAVATAAGLDETGGSLADSLRTALSGRGALIVLDNCEHVVEAAAAVADSMLAAVGDLRLVATSREPLGVPGEAVWRADPMADTDATQLFLERAGQAAGPVDEGAISDLCRRLDGLPLAIELAAARLRSVGLEQLVAGLDDRFRVLGRGPRTGPERQRSLRALVEWSYDLLDESDQRLLAALSVFTGTFDAPAACAVAGLDGDAGVTRLADLADKSLVLLEPGNRYRLLETIRQFAAERLGSGEIVAATRDAHLAYFHAFAEEHGPRLRGATQLESLERCDADRDNLRAAIEWGTSDPAQVERAVAIALALFRFWVVRGYYSEGGRLFDAVLSASPQPTLARAWALQRRGSLADGYGDPVAARAHQEEALTLARALGNLDVEALALNEIGNALRASGSLDGAVAAGREAASVARQPEAAELTRVTCVVNLAGVLLQSGGQREARSLYEEAASLLRLLGDEFGLGIVLQNLGVAAYQAGDLSAALAFTTEGAAIAERLGNRQGQAIGLDMIAQVELERGDIAAAKAASRDAIAILRDVGNEILLSIALGTLGEIGLNGGGDPAATIAEKLQLDRQYGLAANEAIALGQQARLHAARGADDEGDKCAVQALELARSAGNEMVTAEALGAAAVVSCAAGRVTAAIDLFEQAASRWRELGHELRLARTLDALADALDAGGEATRADDVRTEARATRNALGRGHRRAGLAGPEDPANPADFSG